MLSHEPVPSKVVVHPLVLLSVVDHYARMGKIGNKKRVVGVLLGSMGAKGILDVSNSFAVPFDEDNKDKSVWFLDHDYLETMFNMFKKVNAKERIVGWYHSGPKLCQNDVNINEIMKKFNPNSILVIIDTEELQDHSGLPTEAYRMVEEVHDDGTPTSKSFIHIPSDIGAEEVEEVGVEHLLRDIRNMTLGSVGQEVTNKFLGLKGLSSQLEHMKDYLLKVVDKKLPMNHQIIFNLQDIFNLMPDMTQKSFTDSFYMSKNDQIMAVYLASLVRSIIALHNLIDNKIKNRTAEKEAMTKAHAESTSASKATTTETTAAPKDKESKKE